MKLSLEVSKSAPAITGAVLKQHKVMPQHAELLRKVPRRGRPILGRMFDAAVTSRLTEDFPISISSANAENLVSIVSTRSRARRLERDNPYATGIITAYQNNVVGYDPFRLKMKVGKKDKNGVFIEETETNDKIEAAWCEAGLPENCTVRRDLSRLELYLQVISSVVRDGGILGRHYRLFPNNKFGYAIDTIEVDRLDQYWNRPAVGTSNEIQFAIEMDQFHAPVAYWVLTRHPGDVFAWSSSPKYRERIDAKDIIPLWTIRTRAGQYVGMSRLASVIQRLHRLDQYDVAEMTAAIVAACKMGFFTKTGDTSDEYVGDEETEEGDKIMKAEPGLFQDLPFGYDVKEHDPKHPVEAYPNFTKQNLRAVGAGAGIAYHTLANDLESVNFSSGRLGENAQRDEFIKLQNHMILSFVRPHFNEWLKYAILSGTLELDIKRLEEFKRAAVFNGRRWAYVNPLQDAQADVLRINAGLDSRDHVIAQSERGGDVETIDSEIAAGKKVDIKHELNFDATQATEPPVDLEGDGNGPEQTPKKTGGKQTIKAKRGLSRLLLGL